MQQASTKLLISRIPGAFYTVELLSHKLGHAVIKTFNIQKGRSVHTFKVLVVFFVYLTVAYLEPTKVSGFPTNKIPRDVRFCFNMSFFKYYYLLLLLT